MPPRHSGVPGPISIYRRDHLLPSHPPRGSAHQTNPVSNPILRKPELIQEMPSAGVSGVGEHGVIAHCRGREEGTEGGEKWKNVGGWPISMTPHS